VAHEISRSTVAFFSASARELNLGRICPFEFEDGITRTPPEKTLAAYYTGTPYEWLFMGTFWDRLQLVDTDPSTQLKWKAPFYDQPMVKAFTHIVHTIIELLEVNKAPNDIVFCLYIYYDAHVPLMCALEDMKSTQNTRPIFFKHQPRTSTVLHEGELPDIIHMQLQCSFWNENKTKMSPIVHLMCKALPQRCQIRNLREIISNYCRENTLVHEFMRSALLCSLLGMYKHSKHRLSWDTRKQLIRRFIYEKPNRMQMQEWLFTMYQHLLFYIIKEFLTFSMRLIPALYDELCTTYKWHVFEATVHQAMDTVRSTVESNMKHSSIIQDWLAQIESILLQVNKQQLGNLYRPQRQTFTQNVLHMCERMDETQHQVNPHVKFPLEYTALLRHMAKRVERGRVHIEWLRFFHVKQTSIDSLINMQEHYHQNTYRADLRKLLQASTRYDFEAIRELFAVFQQTHHSVRIFHLPQHYYDKQLLALRHRYSMGAEEPLLPHVGKVYVCLSCNTFKGFLVKSEGKCTNLFANGHHKIIIDDDTLKCYCGRRCDKSDTKKRKRIAIQDFVDGVEIDENRKRRIKKDWKTRRKSMQNNLCAATECMAFNMTGCIFQYYNTLYIFCPSCGNPTTFQPGKYDRHGFTCGQCIQQGTLYTHVCCYICEIYRGKDSWVAIQSIDENKKEKSVPICNNCLKPWLRQSDQPVPFKVLESQKNKYQRTRKKS
jgi:hypothetical protein